MTCAGKAGQYELDKTKRTGSVFTPGIRPIMVAMAVQFAQSKECPNDPMGTSDRDFDRPWTDSWLDRHKTFVLRHAPV